MAELVDAVNKLEIDNLEIDNGDFFARLTAVPGNDVCADCTSTENLTWASSNLGVVVCNECVGAHRSLGVHISKPLSLKMDTWDDAHQATMLALGNSAVNADLEAHPDAAARKPKPDDAIEHKAAYVKSKYASGAFRAAGDGKVAADAHHSERFKSEEQVLPALNFRWM